MTRRRQEVDLVLTMVDWGLNDCQISRLTAVPRGTVRGWRMGNFAGATTSNSGAGWSSCPICAGRQLPRDLYAYLLGLYLGDGALVHIHRGVYRIDIAMDARYPSIIDECCLAMNAVLGRERARVQSRQTWVHIQSYWKHWPCVFPQHGPGRKHLRSIKLEPWQDSIVKEHPKALLRGLIHSDGCRSMNRIRRPMLAEHPKEGQLRLERHYEYPRYQFTNNSSEIRGIFCTACHLLDIPWRQMNWKTISVAQRQAVQRLDQFIGPKT